MGAPKYPPTALVANTAIRIRLSVGHSASELLVHDHSNN
jgi:hypothetical protein